LRARSYGLSENKPFPFSVFGRFGIVSVNYVAVTETLSTLARSVGVWHCICVRVCVRDLLAFPRPNLFLIACLVVFGIVIMCTCMHKLTAFPRTNLFLPVCLVSLGNMSVNYVAVTETLSTPARSVCLALYLCA